MSANHVLITPQTCPCDKRSDTSCNVCDGGLAICSMCGKAEAELDQPCAPSRPERVWLHVHVDADCWCSYHYDKQDDPRFLTEYVNAKSNRQLITQLTEALAGIEQCALGIMPIHRDMDHLREIIISLNDARWTRLYAILGTAHDAHAAVAKERAK